MIFKGSKEQLLIIALYCLESTARGVLLALVPLQLLEKMGTPQNVTVVYALVSFFALGNSILVPSLIQKFGLRIVVGIAGALQICAAALLTADSISSMAIGLVLRAIGSSCVEIPLVSLIMQSVTRDRLSAFEPTRIVFSGMCMALSPWIGFQLHQTLFSYAPNIVAIVGGALIIGLALLWLPRGVPAEAFKKTRLGIEAFTKFLSQPRLCVAWILAVVRTSFWTIFFIYAPIFTVLCGWTPSSASALISAGIATMIFVPTWGFLVRRLGVRRILILGYSLTGGSLLLAAVTATFMPFFAPALLFVAALSASLSDGPGNVLFMRASHVHDRPAMAGLYMTYRDAGQFSAIALFSTITVAFHLTIAFMVAATTFFGAAMLSRTIHPRLK